MTNGAGSSSSKQILKIRGAAISTEKPVSISRVDKTLKAERIAIWQQVGMNGKKKSGVSGK